MAPLAAIVATRERRLGQVVRLLDVAVAATTLLAVAPLLLLLAAAVKLCSRGPALFAQQRVGRGGAPFRLWKLRTMVVDAERIGPRVTGRDDPRITRVGRFLRKTKLDELPQLWNVLVGDMSLVGPRPEVAEMVAQAQAAYAALLRVRPGLISEATLAFRREEELLPQEGRAAFYVREILPKKVALDLAWLEQRTFVGDLELLARAFLLLTRLRRDERPLSLPGGHALRLAVKMALDGALAGAAFVVATLLRFDGWPDGVERERLVMLALPITLLTALFASVTGCARAIWRCFDTAQFLRLALLHAPLLLAQASWRARLPTELQLLRTPWSVVVLSYLLALLAGAAARRLWSASTARAERRGRPRSALSGRIALIGAGRHAHAIVHELQRSAGGAVELLACFDDDPGKRGSHVAGVRVVGTLAEAPGWLARTRPDHLLIAIAALPEAKLRPLLDAAALCGAAVKIVPSLVERAQAPAGLLRDLSLADLIGRPPVRLDPSDPQIAQAWRGKTILVTGAAGSIGSELVRQLVALSPRRLVLLDKDENGLFELGRELDDLAPALPRALAVLSLCDRRGVARLLRRERPDVVLHAAAHKHVPLMEANVVEAVANNALGTRDFARLAAAARVGSFVLISTDKAVRPTSVMGATKRAAELAVRELNERARVATRFVVVRFGNVLASRGSVIETFLRQLRRGDPLTITHPDVERFFLSIPEAAQLVLVAGSLPRPRGHYVLEMGKPRRIVDLARDLARLAGGPPPRLKFVGLRPGEKLSEELSGSGALESVPERPGLLVDAEPAPATEVVVALDRALRRAVAEGDGEAARRVLERPPIGLRPAHAPQPAPGEATARAVAVAEPIDATGAASAARPVAESLA
ncbi:MAG: polysaccharide biosynthesis protein [Planctomycetes bacterium]|nr:polysaccharide biosynthesis protein [Planctomycetota bacterium]